MLKCLQFNWEERFVIAHAKTEWIIKLNYAFQSRNLLFLVMDCMLGSLSNLIVKNSYFNENDVKFYCAEMILALDALHEMGFLHRDIKPCNFLIDQQGHLKLTDFGICLRMDEHKMARQVDVGGTTVFMPPEAFDDGNEIGREYDYWAIGVTLYQLFFNKFPFDDEREENLIQKILNHVKHFKFPSNSSISTEAQSLILAFLTDRENRLGRNGIEELKKNKFFNGVNWNFDNIRSFDPPKMLQINCNFGPSTAFYDDLKREKLLNDNCKQLNNEFQFVGFTYCGENQDFSNEVMWDENLKLKIRLADLEDQILYSTLRMKKVEAEWKTKYEKEKKTYEDSIVIIKNYNKKMCETIKGLKR